MADATADAERVLQWLGAQYEQQPDAWDSLRDQVLSQYGTDPKQSALAGVVSWLDGLPEEDRRQRLADEGGYAEMAGWFAPADAEPADPEPAAGWASGDGGAAGGEPEASGGERWQDENGQEWAWNAERQEWEPAGEQPPAGDVARGAEPAAATQVAPEVAPAVAPEPAGAGPAVAQPDAGPEGESGSTAEQFFADFSEQELEQLVGQGVLVFEAAD